MSAPLGEQQLAEIRARVEGIAPGPWAVDYDGCDCDEGCTDRLAVGFGPFTSVENAHRDVTPEAEFAAAARQDVPALLAEVDRLRVQVANVRAFAVSHEYRWLHELLDGYGTHGGAL
ncbi:hypothetical protein ACWERV_17270 [Streptomyces sp. NPDC004031]